MVRVPACGGTGACAAAGCPAYGKTTVSVTVSTIVEVEVPVRVIGIVRVDVSLIVRVSVSSVVARDVVVSVAVVGNTKVVPVNSVVVE